jgi:hypothetical protein
MDRFLNLRDTVTPYPTGQQFRGSAVPGTSCQATIVPSLQKGEKGSRLYKNKSTKETSPPILPKEKSGLARIGWWTLECLGHLCVLCCVDATPVLRPGDRSNM